MLSDDTKATKFGITDAKLYRLGARDIFLQSILLRIFRRIGTFRSGNGCDILVSCHQHGGFVETSLVNFSQFDEFLPDFLYGQILHGRKFLTKGL